MRKLNCPLLIAACLAVSFFCLAYPLYVIRPFRHQGVRELAAALLVLQIRPIATALSSVGALIALILYWRMQRRVIKRIAAAAGVLCVFLFTALSRVNIYEMMFHPMGPPSFQSARETKLDGREMVVAVNIGGVGRAYPIRIISYHHIVNDVIAGVPIVATY
jgi:uncharacterized protein DUF3179